MVALATVRRQLILAVGTVRGLCFHGRTYPRPANTPVRFKTSHLVGTVLLRSFASDQLGAAESPSTEIKAVRFKVDAVEIKINAVEIKVDAVEIKVDAVDICLRGDSEEIANSTNVQVLTYKLLKKRQLQEEKRQLQEEKRQLREEKRQLQEEKNKLMDLEILPASKGATSYLAFLECLLLLLNPVEYPYALRH